ncbi:hypothetical protein RND81_05G077500 [Saponaria officinalis]|uniref:Uncharacterized protein n=1 Tax=Saponaria officinalis TaxID=3572 RepID=A0AAW1KR77_SAPOF
MSICHATKPQPNSQFVLVIYMHNKALMILLQTQQSLSISYIIISPHLIIMMLSTTFELITLVSSNYHFLFCFCNVIIIFLLFGSLKSSVSSSRDDFESLQAQNGYDSYIVEVNDIIIEENTNGKDNQEDVIIIEQHYDNEHEEEEDQSAVVGEDNDYDDCLRRKFEAFINKVNQERRVENLSTAV